MIISGELAGSSPGLNIYICMLVDESLTRQCREIPSVLVNTVVSYNHALITSPHSFKPVIAHGDKAISLHCPVCMHVCHCQW